MTHTPTRDGVLRAAKKIAQILPPTPLLPLEVHGRLIWCKAECLQPIGAFKIRGAWHRLTDMTEDERKRGVVAFSSGNHAQGVAWAAKALGMPALIVMPDDAPRAKMQATEALGAEIVTYDRATANREALAAGLAEERGAVLVPSFDDPWVIEGQGSCGVEIAAQMEALHVGGPDHVIACCGGGGLASGIALACQKAWITIVEPEGWDDAARSLAAGEIVRVPSDAPQTSCDALQTPAISPLTFNILKEADAMTASVTEAEIAFAMRVAFERLHLVLEPGGAVALAAVLAGKAKLTGRTVVTLSGGNVDWLRFIKMAGSAS